MSHLLSQSAVGEGDREAALPGGPAVAVATAAACPAGSPAGLSPVAPSPASRHDRHFATEHLMADLKGRSIRGGAVTLSSQGVKFALQVGSTMVLARLLTPADFGLIAMVAVFAGFVRLCKDIGLSMATAFGAVTPPGRGSS